MGLSNVLTAVSIGMMAVIAFPALANAADSTITIMENKIVRQTHGTAPTNEWVLYTRDTGTGTFRTGPATPPLGAGSLELSTTTENDKVYLFNYEHLGKELGDITAMSYDTYRSQGNLQQVAALNIEVDVNGSAAGGYTVLVFEPVYNTDQGPVVSGEWQDWDAINLGNAVWWSSRDIPGVDAFNSFVSWNDILKANPDAVIVNGFGVNQGGGNPGLITAVDKLLIGTAENTITYNFEPTPVKATSKDQCKNGGYKNFQTEYKNQGDCVSSVASGSKAKGNPQQDNPVVSSFLRAIGLR